MAFRSIYTHGFLRVAACTLETAIAEPARNARSILAAARDCDRSGVGLAVFPELSVSGYALDDLFLQQALHEAVAAALDAIVEGSRDLLPVLVVGAPLRHRHRLYNTAVVVHRGAVLGVVPKSFLPNYREFYERRHFASGAGVRGETIRARRGRRSTRSGPTSSSPPADVPGFTLGVEICEDMWVPEPPAGALALAGATVLANLSGSPITIGRARSRNLLCQATSARCLAAYVYAAAGAGESTTDLSLGRPDRHLRERRPAGRGRALRRRAGQVTAADIDLDLLRQERLSTGSFDDNARAGAAASNFRTVPFRLRSAGRATSASCGPGRALPLRAVRPRALLAQDCYEAYNIQVAGLKQRLSGHRGRSASPSGCRAASTPPTPSSWPPRPSTGSACRATDILAYTMPGFATGEGTKSNAHRLMASLGVTAHELDIRPAAGQMLKRPRSHPYSRGPGPTTT